MFKQPLILWYKIINAQEKILANIYCKLLLKQIQKKEVFNNSINNSKNNNNLMLRFNNLKLIKTILNL